MDMYGRLGSHLGDDRGTNGKFMGVMVMDPMMIWLVVAMVGAVLVMALWHWDE